jgi:hypothetical protein
MREKVPFSFPARVAISRDWRLHVHLDEIKVRGATYNRVLAKTLTQCVGRQAMRELLGKIPTKDPNVSEQVYLSELVRCSECQRTVPIGIEVVTVKKGAESREVLRHQYYCRAHGLD